jgi:hypothetical protein
MSKHYKLFVFVLVLAFSTALQAQSNAEYEKFLKDACETFLENSKKINEEYKIASFERWDFNQDSGQIVFSDKGVKKLVADVQVAGSWAANNTWMWAWNNKSLEKAMIKDLLKVRDFGASKKYSEFTTPVFASDLDYAWTLTAAAGYITKAKTSYRGENGTGYVYFLITDLKWVK